MVCNKLDYYQWQVHVDLQTHLYKTKRGFSGESSAGMLKRCQ